MNNKIKNYFVVFLSSLGGLLAYINLPFFFYIYHEAAGYGFNDFLQLRFLYNPYGFYANEWATILLCILPFPIIGFFIPWEKIYIRFGFLLIVGVLVFNILLTFSRAGILALLLFVLLINVLFYFYRVVSVKKLVLSDGALILFLLFFYFAFSSSIQTFNQSDSQQRSIEGRFNQWERSLSVIEKHPFFGIGSKNYALLGHQPEQTNLENTFSGRVNNTYIQLATEKGLAGLLLWLSAIGVCIYSLFKQLNRETDFLEKVINCTIISAIFAILFKELFFSSLIYNISVLFLFILLLAFNQNKNIQSIKIQKWIAYTGIILIVVSAVFFYIKKPENALTYASKGLEFERKGDYKDAIQFYKKAYLTNPSDALFLNNLGRLYWMTCQQDSAINYLTQAVKTDPEIAIYHISKGLIIEKQNMKEAFESYKQAILLSPDIIDSHFFEDLKKRFPSESEILLKEACNELVQVNADHNSSIIEAKIGKLYLSTGEIELAYKTLVHVSQILPNLNRPWYYLGIIEQQRGNYETMVADYKKSMFLSPTDHLPLYALAAYYKKIGDNERAISYNKEAEVAWKNKRTVHSLRCEITYYMDTEKDDVVPKGFLDYITPIFKIINYDTIQ